MKRNGEQLYYPQSGTEGCRAATIHNVPDPLCILDEKSCSEHVTFSFFAYYINKKKYLCKRIKLYEKRSDCNLQRREQLHST